MAGTITNVDEVLGTKLRIITLEFLDVPNEQNGAETILRELGGQLNVMPRASFVPEKKVQELVQNSVWRAASIYLSQRNSDE